MMEMTNAEIKRRYEEAETARKKQKQIRIMAELNGCSQQKIRGILGLSEPQTKKRSKSPKVPDSVLDAVRTRVFELERKAAALRSTMEQHTKSLDAFMAEWAELKEWQQEHDHQTE